MKHINSGLYYCFLAAMIGLPGGADAEVARWNSSRSYADAYRQVNAQRQGIQQPTETGAATKAATAAAELPVRVADKDLANKIAAGESGTGVNMDTLQQCALIYPDAKFEWTRPTLGVNANTAPMCTAIVELYAFGAGQNGENIVVARGNLAAGDAFKCNISEFPSETWLPAAGTVVFPNDTEPTQQDVIEIMNQEQKQGAGMKIIAGTVLAGLAGNVIGKNEPGKDGILGGGKDKLASTFAAAAGGGALMAASAYSGKVAGDMIASAGINAALGSVVGNIAATGKEVLRVEKCDLDGKTVDCLYGHIVETSDKGEKEEIFIKQNDENAFMVCEKTTDPTTKCMVNGIARDDCLVNCVTETMRVGSGFIAGDSKEKYTNTDAKITVKDMADDEFSKIDNDYKYVYYDGKMIPWNKADGLGGEAPVYVKVISGVSKITKKTPAAIAPYHDKAFGTKEEDWDKGLTGATIFYRSLGKLQECTGCDFDKFDPETIAASDGGVIDMNNKARLGATLTGAGAGAGIGAFSAYQGAQTEIQDRWTAAVREYKDSLQKFYCWSGNRFLAFYNDVVMIPTMPTNSENTAQ